ncbi:alpha/beta fold hydrolase [Deinococcus radiomollis]|uniref:alpha/beta fold hydrolase n=1 Tax=Deinococcus radiomollis TaxID=468916 RepID=UPI0038916BEA
MQINGTDLNVQQTGAGTPVLMLHGLGSNIGALEPEIERFSRAFRVIAVDSRGHGHSGKPAAYTLEDHIGDVLALMDALELETAHLIGSSAGSYVAQGAAARQPERVNRLVLITPKSNGKTSSVARFVSEHAEELRGRSQAEVQAFVTEHLFAPQTPAEVRRQMADFARQQQQDGLALTPEQESAAQRALEGFDLRPVLPRITAPTLVVSGRHDPLNPVADGEEVARLIPNARFEVLEHSGHLPGREEPERLWGLVEAFLQS